MARLIHALSVPRRCAPERSEERCADYEGRIADMGSALQHAMGTLQPESLDALSALQRGLTDAAPDASATRGAEVVRDAQRLLLERS